jgi:pimeloyl-ACP methyl ester carboxylesterase
MVVADNVTAIKFADTGHWLMEERPVETKAALKRFFEPAVQANQR